jgi:hypothetical protein
LLLEAIGVPQAGAFARIYGLKNRLRAKYHMLSANSVAIATGMPAASPPRFNDARQRQSFIAFGKTTPANTPENTPKSILRAFGQRSKMQ